MTEIGEAVPLAVIGVVEPTAVHEARYPVIGEPPSSLDGVALNATAIVPVPAVKLMSEGAFGTVSGGGKTL